MSPPRRTPTRALALGAVVAVLGLAFSARPSITIYDGLVIPPPYLWLQPGPGEPGNPPSARTTLPVSGGSSPLLALATSEDVPQAQVFAIPGGLELPAGTTRIDVSITAVPPPPTPPSDGHIAGNVYEFKVVNQAGAAITANPAASVSVVLRAPDPTTASGTVARWNGTAWQSLIGWREVREFGILARFGGLLFQFFVLIQLTLMLFFAPLSADPAALPAATVVRATTRAARARRELRRLGGRSARPSCPGRTA